MAFAMPDLQIPSELQHYHPLISILFYLGDNDRRISMTSSHTHTHTQPFNGQWSGTTRVGRYQKKHSPTHTHHDHRTSFINFLHLLRSIASSVFSLHAWQSSLTTSLQVLFGLPHGLAPSTSYSVHFFTQSSSSFRSTCDIPISTQPVLL